MRKEECYLLGYIAKTYGFKGSVSFFLDVSSPSEYKNLETVFIEVNKNELIPFFVQNISVEIKKNFAKVKLEDVDNETDAKKIVRKNLYLPLADLPKLKGNHFYDHEVIGFKIIDVNFGEIGQIKKILDYPKNPLFEIQKNGNEILFPLNQEFIINLDRNKKEIVVEAPDGYFDIYDF